MAEEVVEQTGADTAEQGAAEAEGAADSELSETITMRDLAHGGEVKEFTRAQAEELVSKGWNYTQKTQQLADTVRERGDESARDTIAQYLEDNPSATAADIARDFSIEVQGGTAEAATEAAASGGVSPEVQQLFNELRTELDTMRGERVIRDVQREHPLFGEETDAGAAAQLLFRAAASHKPTWERFGGTAKAVAGTIDKLLKTQAGAAEAAKVDELAEKQAGVPGAATGTTAGETATEETRDEMVDQILKENL